MAVRKIKDLIREMVLKNQSDAHQYTHAMGNFVFDFVDYEPPLDAADINTHPYADVIANLNKFDEYIDEILDATEQKDEEYDKEIQRINADIKKQKAILAKLTHKKEAGQLLSEDEQKALIDLNKAIKSQRQKKQETIAEKMQKSFVNLDSAIKKYACLRYLSNECVKNTDFKTETDEDGVIYADEREFKSSEMARKFREISDYVNLIFSDRGSKITKPSSIIEQIKLDAQKLGLLIEPSTPANIVTIYNELLADIAKQNRNNQTEEEQIELSHIGIEAVQDFGDDLVMYRLLPDTEYYNQHNQHRNFVYEGDQMDICIGQKGQPYPKRILFSQRYQYYSLRKKQPNGQLIPYCTIEVDLWDGIILQIKGKSNGPVTEQYIQPVRNFLKKHFNVTFPGEKEKFSLKLGHELNDYSNIGFVPDVHNNIVDIFNLPPNTELDEISYNLFTAEGIDKKNIKSIQLLKFENCKITQQELDQIKKNHLIKNFNLDLVKLYGKFDFSNENKLEVIRGNLSKAKVKFNPNAEIVNLRGAIGLQGKCNFSGVKKLDLSASDLSKAEIKFNPNAEHIGLSSVNGLHGKHDFSGVTKIFLTGSDLSKAEIKFNPNAEYIGLSNTKGLHGTYDFSGVKKLELVEADLNKVQIKFNPNAEDINLAYSKGLHGTYDFSGVKQLGFTNCDLSKAEIKFNPNADLVGLKHATGLHGTYDFSGMKKLELEYCDLSKAEIKFNPNADLVALKHTTGLHGTYDFSSIKKLELEYCDLRKAEIKFNPNAEHIGLSDTNGLHGTYDFSGVKQLKLTHCDLGETEIKFNPNAEHINLWYSKDLHGTYDFSGVKDLVLTGCNLSKTDIIFNPNADYINLTDTKGLHGTYDFSGVKQLDLAKTDLSKVDKIIVGPQTKVVDNFHIRNMLKIKRLNENSLTNKVVNKVDNLKKGIENILDKLKQKLSTQNRDNDSNAL
jgi:hypothetical protein